MSRSCSPAAAGSPAARGQRGPAPASLCAPRDAGGLPATHLELQPVDHRRVVLHAAAAHTPRLGARSRRAPTQRPFIPSARSRTPSGPPGGRRAHFRCFPDTSSVRSSLAANGGGFRPVRMPAGTLRAHEEEAWRGGTGAEPGAVAASREAGRRSTGEASPGTALSPPRTRSRSRPLRSLLLGPLPAHHPGSAHLGL